MRWGRLSAGSQRIERRDASTHAKPQSQLCICRTWGTSSTPAPEVDAREASAARRLSATRSPTVPRDGKDRRRRPSGRCGRWRPPRGLGDGTGGGSRGDGRALHGEWWVGGVTRGGGRATTLHHGTESTRGVGGESIDPRRKYLGAHSRVRVPPLRGRARDARTRSERSREEESLLRASSIAGAHEPSTSRRCARTREGVVVRRARPGHLESSLARPRPSSRHRAVSTVREPSCFDRFRPKGISD